MTENLVLKLYHWLGRFAGQDAWEVTQTRQHEYIRMRVQGDLCWSF